MREPVRIGNCSGFFGDRLAAAREMVDGGPLDVLMGDWLAELTMLILARQRLKHGPGSGYARTFLVQMEDVLGTCLDRGIRVVSNAGGLDPVGCAGALHDIAQRLGLEPRIATVTGDDLMPRLDDLRREGEAFVNLDTGETLDEAGAHLLTANAYLGGEGITRALDQGADVVITGRVTDAALVIGPAAWWHGWAYDEDHRDRLAGAVVAGHAIECGTQVTGGNYSFFTELPGMEHPGFPIAEVAADGSSVITKHPGTGGAVTVGTVTAQLLYEIGPPEYANPDATALFDTIRLTQEGPDRVRISDVRGAPPPSRLKVAATYLGGFRNALTLVVTGMDADAKADLALRSIVGLSMADIASPESTPAQIADRASLDVAELIVAWDPSPVADPAAPADAQSYLRLTARDPDPQRVGKPFTTAVIEATLASYPGMFPTTPPGEPTPFGVYWPTTVARESVAVDVEVFTPDADGGAA